MLQNQQLAAAAALAEAEVEALRSVATRILRASELDEALLAVTNETLGLLDSDIAGVMLRDGDEIVMSACAGNQLADTGNLRMRRGQGLAGHVFATGQAAKVDDYLRNDVISDDFNYLARAEKTRSALGAPLVVRGEVIGVLEVWRRRESVFTDNDIRRLVALADLAAIALDNARQHEISAASGRAVVEAHSALRVQFGKVEHALLGQQALIEALIDGEQLAGIARIVAEQTQCEVALLDRDLEVLAGTHSAADLARVTGGGALCDRSGQARAGTHWVRAGGDRGSRSGPSASAARRSAGLPADRGRGRRRGDRARRNPGGADVLAASPGTAGRRQGPRLDARGPAAEPAQGFRRRAAGGRGAGEKPADRSARARCGSRCATSPDSTRLRTAPGGVRRTWSGSDGGCCSDARRAWPAVEFCGSPPAMSTRSWR